LFYRDKLAPRNPKVDTTMKTFEIEHIGICVEKPSEMANRYLEVLGFNIKFSAQDDEKGVAFLTDGSDRVMLELGNVPNVLPLTKGICHHLQFHIALKSEDPDKEAEYLISKGATFIEKISHQDARGELSST
jgi:hypothetical protein